jgi:hypothetical protein
LISTCFIPPDKLHSITNKNTADATDSTVDHERKKQKKDNPTFKKFALLWQEEKKKEDIFIP